MDLAIGLFGGSVEFALAAGGLGSTELYEGLVLEGLRGFVLRVLVGFVADGLLLDGFVGVWLGRDETGLDGAVSGLVVAAGLGVGSKEMLTVVVPKPMRELTLTRTRLKGVRKAAWRGSSAGIGNGDSVLADGNTDFAVNGAVER